MTPTAINAIGYDATTIGNHEYDFGPERLAQFITGADKAQFLTANTDFTGEPSLQALRDAGRIANSVVVNKGGQEIGIIGISPPETPDDLRRRAASRSTLDRRRRHRQRGGRGLTDAGVNKIILSSHLQDSANERRSWPSSRTSTSSSPAAPTTCWPTRATCWFPVPTARRRLARTRCSSSDAGQARPDGHHPGRVPLRRPPHGHVRRGRQHRVDRRVARSGPVRVTADPAQPDYAAEDTALKARITDPLVAYKANLAANKIGTTRRAARRRQPEPDPPARSPTSATSSPTASWPRSTAPRSRTGARWRTSRSPTAAASARRSRPATSPRRAPSTCCRSTTSS